MKLGEDRLDVFVEDTSPAASGASRRREPGARIGGRRGHRARAARPRAARGGRGRSCGFRSRDVPQAAAHSPAPGPLAASESLCARKNSHTSPRSATSLACSPPSAASKTYRRSTSSARSPSSSAASSARSDADRPARAGSQGSPAQQLPNAMAGETQMHPRCKAPRHSCTCTPQVLADRYHRPVPEGRPAESYRPLTSRGGRRKTAIPTAGAIPPMAIATAAGFSQDG
jgi:hypothetical protein